MPEDLGRVKIWCLVRKQESYIKPVEQVFGDRAEFLYDEQWDPARMLEQRPDLVLCVNDWPYEVSLCLDAARAHRIPSLVLQDGILEWRCQYENPLFGAGGGAPQHQPVLADKIACLGKQSARQIAAWGNEGKVETTGMPRLDHLFGRSTPVGRRSVRRLLIMTAKTVGFTPRQTEITFQSLVDVKNYVEKRNDIEATWRVGRVVQDRLGVVNRFNTVSSEELAGLLENVDAVISTPSTAILEAMMMQRPVAALDYHNVPRFVPTAWTISAPQHIPDVVQELLNPSERKMEFQRTCLRDCLDSDAPAAPKVARLIEKMIAHARAAEGEGTLQFPPDLLGEGFAPVEHVQPDLAALYPQQPIFRDNDGRSLQVRLARLQKRNEELEQTLRQRSLGYTILLFGRRLARAIGLRR